MRETPHDFPGDRLAGDQSKTRNREANILEIRHLTKRFPGVVALRDVAFDLRPGEIHALCGENGAGKSTLIKVLSGVHAHGSYDGEILVDDRPVHFRNVRDAEAAGIAVIMQELALVPEMTVAENIYLGREPRRGLRIDRGCMHRDAARLLAQFGLPVEPETPVHRLGVGHKQLIEIARSLDKHTRVLVLDEPTAALTEREVETLLDILRQLRAQGTACIYISHKLDEVFAIADRITVLRDGASVAQFPAREASIPRLIRHMVGREINELFPRMPPTGGPGDVRLRVRNLTVAPDKLGPPYLQNISFALRAGEVLGFGGLMGAGRTELLMHLFGAWGQRRGGSVELRDAPYDDPTPLASIRRGLVLVSEDRRRYGLVLEQPIGFNLSLSSLGRFTRFGKIDGPREHVRNQELFDQLRVKAPGQRAAAGGLSGGNQQKVVLGKALMTEPAVVMLDEPTRGIDVGAKLEVYQLINQLTDAGEAVILVSSELPELMGMSDRIIMLHEGVIGGEFTRDQFVQEKLLAAAMGHAHVA